MALDEVPEIGQEILLEQGVTVGRENRLEVIVSTQSLEKLYAIAPDLNPSKTEHYTNAMLAGFTTYACFQAGDPVYNQLHFKNFSGIEQGFQPHVTRQQGVWWYHQSLRMKSLRLLIVGNAI